MLILEDTRQQEFKHDLKHKYFRSVGVMCNRTKLYCGDYTLPTNQTVCVDTKKDIQELIGDIQVRKTPKKDIEVALLEIFKCNSLDGRYSEIFHIICDDDDGRFPEREIADWCYGNGFSESTDSLLQGLYVKRQGSFHRELKRAENSKIKLIVLVENKDSVGCIEDLFYWVNPRLMIYKNSDQIIGYFKNGKPKYKKIQKFPTATKGEILAKSLFTMQLRYGVKFMFCRPEESGEMVIKLLSEQVE